MLSGDLGTFPFSDLFQWLDQSRKAGVLTVGPFWLRVTERRIVGAARPKPSPLSSAVETEDSALWPEACLDRIHDLFAMPSSTTFFFTDAADDAQLKQDGWASSSADTPREEVPLSLDIIETLLESMRHLDEEHGRELTFPSEAAVLRARPGTARSPGLAAVHAAAQRGLTIAAARLGLGLSRAAILRRVSVLCAAGLVDVEGAMPGQSDPVSMLLSQAEILIHENQFDEAQLVLRSLLAADVFHRRARLLLAEAERKQLAVLYEEIEPTTVLTATSTDNAIRWQLSPVELEIVAQVKGKQGRLSVQSLVLASSAFRELEILKALRRLVRGDLIDLIDPIDLADAPA